MERHITGTATLQKTYGHTQGNYHKNIAALHRIRICPCHEMPLLFLFLLLFQYSGKAVNSVMSVLHKTLEK